MAALLSALHLLVCMTQWEIYEFFISHIIAVNSVKSNYQKVFPCFDDTPVLHSNHMKTLIRHWGRVLVHYCSPLYSWKTVCSACYDIIKLQITILYVLKSTIRVENKIPQKSESEIKWKTSLPVRIEINRTCTLIFNNRQQGPSSRIIALKSVISLIAQRDLHFSLAK